MTIADARHRFKGIGAAPPATQKKALQLWLDRLQPPEKLVADAPIQPVIDIITSLVKRKEYSLVYLTGRSEKYREATATWLKKVKAPKATLLMRPDTDWRTPRNFKMSVMKKLATQHKDIMILDDDGAGDCSKAYQKAGWLQLKVIL